MASLQVRVVSPAQIVYEGEAASVVAPAWDGQVGILPRHAPMITLLGAGTLSVDLVGGGSRALYVAGGALQVVDDQVTILTEYAADTEPAELPEGILRGEDVKDLLAEQARQSKGNPLV